VENNGLLISAESVQGDRIPMHFARRPKAQTPPQSNKQAILVLFNHDSNMAAMEPPPTVPPPRKRVAKKASKRPSDSNEDGQDDDNMTYETTTPLSSMNIFAYFLNQLKMHKGITRF
jgi:hypothetical protein